MTWKTGDGVKMYDSDNATLLAPYDMVQLIADGGNGFVDDPMEMVGAGTLDLNTWLAAGCPPVGDDYLVSSVDVPNPHIITDFSYLPWYDPLIHDGEFSAVYIDSGLATPLNVYTRIFDSAQGLVVLGDEYGNVGWWDEDDVYHDFFTVVPDGGGFVYYTITHDDYTDIVIPEPATMVIGGVALLLAFFRRKK